MGDSVINDSIVRLKWKNNRAMRITMRREYGELGAVYKCEIPEHVFQALNRANYVGKNKCGTSWYTDMVAQLWLVGGSGTQLKNGSSYMIGIGTANY